MLLTPKRTAFSLFASFVVLLLSSCAHRYYYPKPLAPPLLSSAKQVKLSGMMSFNFLNPIGTISVAGSPVNHLGVQLAAGTASYKETLSESGIVRHDERQWNPEVSAGYYKKLSPGTLFEIYGGLGAYNYKDNSAALIKNLKHSDLFLQPSVALVNRNVELAFTLRYDHLQRRSIVLDTSQGSVSEAAYTFLNRDQYDFIEPGITFRFGSKQVMAQFQFSENFAFNRSYESIYGGFKKSGQVRYAFGLLVNLHNFFSNKRG